LSGIFDIPGVRDTGDPPDPDDDTSPGRGEGHDEDEDSGDLETLRRTVAELQRRDRERENEMVQLVARNTVLEAQGTKPPPDPTPKHTPEQLKAWAESDEGDEFSAAVQYTNQKAEEIEDRVVGKLKQEEGRKKLLDNFTRTLPDLKDPNSAVTREVHSLTEQKFAEGVGTTREEAMVAALVEVAANKGIRTVKEPPLDPKEHSRRRRVESSGGTGAPAGAPAPTKTLTEEHLQMAHRFGLKDVFSDDKNKRNAARAGLLEEINAEEERRNARGW
jgi:hypothetical protein